MSTLTIGTGALARRTFAGRCAAFVLVPCFASGRSSLSRHFGNEASLASERLAVTSPAVLSTLPIGTGTFVSCAAGKGAGTTCVLFPRFPLKSRGLARHLGTVIAGAREGLAIASPAVMITVRPGTGAPGWCASCVILVVCSALWSTCLNEPFMT